MMKENRKLCKLTGRRTKRCAPLKDAQIKFGQEGSVLGTEQSAHANFVTTKDAQTMTSREECALSMGRSEKSANYAGVMVAQIELSKEECVLGMEQRKNYAALVDAQTKPRREEFVLSMEQSVNCVAVKDAQIKFGQEECA